MIENIENDRKTITANKKFSFLIVMSITKKSVTVYNHLVSEFLIILPN